MKWVNHRLVTGTVTWAVTQDVFAVCAAVSGSVFPDRIEILGSQKYHRTISHWWAVYFPVVLWLWPYSGKPADGFVTNRFALYMTFWFFMGAVAHILEDSICGRIPLWHPFRKVYVCRRLFYVGSPREYLFTGFLSVIAILYSFSPSG